jgi:tRNA-2-methylthio-N6-dimethylallyladenosine synthase
MAINVHIQTFGCQMNEYDTELVRSILGQAGYRFTDQEGEADIILLNTCSVRENAHRKVYGHIHEIRHRRSLPAGRQEGRRRVLIGLLGCMATGLREELLENKSLKLDFVVGPDSYKRLPQILESALTKGERGYDVTLSEFETYADVYPARTGGINAWVAVMRGCNNFCSFCVVPLARGRERSRTIPDITSEIFQLISKEGVKQITLLGQNVNSYASEGKDFSNLLNVLSTITGLERIRFTSPHPKDFPDKLMQTIAANPKVCKHIHLPLQSGSTRILNLMNRGYTCEDYLALVHRIRKDCPGIALSTDVIVGFPTETDSEFKDTLALMRKVEFDSAFMFKYSPRKGTAAQKKFKDDVPAAKKTERIVALNALQKEISLKKNCAHIDEIHTVLIEQKGTSRSPEDFEGRTDGNKLVILPPGPYAIGDLIRVKIQKATPHALKGILLAAD